MPKRYDPLSVIPSAVVLRERLREAERTARKLQILLATAEHIEQTDISDPAPPHDAPRIAAGRQGDAK
jgi:hypothetical protein